MKTSVASPGMVGGQLTNSAWVDTLTYNFYNSSSILAPSPDAGDFATRVAVIEGIFDPEGLELRQLDPVFRFPWLSQPTELPAGFRPGSPAVNNYLVEIIDELGARTLTPFIPLLGDDAEVERFGDFTVMVGIDPGVEIASLRIIDAEDSVTFGAFERSEPPRINILFPQEGSELGAETGVAWEVDDPDTPREQLMYQIAYSPDGGINWVPVAVDVPGDQEKISFDSSLIQRSNGDGVIAVFVSDGLNTEMATVNRLTTAGAEFPPPSAAASLELDPPISFNLLGTDHVLTAKVLDAGDSPLADQKVLFAVTGVNATTGSAASDGNGLATFSYNGVNSGADTITAWVDENGNEIQDAGEAFDVATKFWVTEPPFRINLPLVLKK